LISVTGKAYLELVLVTGLVVNACEELETGLELGPEPGLDLKPDVGRDVIAVAGLDFSADPFREVSPEDTGLDLDSGSSKSRSSSPIFELKILYY
jgi:hypothetical protein